MMNMAPVNNAISNAAALPVNNKEIFEGEAKALKGIRDSYIAPYKNAPKGTFVTTALDLYSGKNARNALIAVEQRLNELNVNYLA